MTQAHDTCPACGKPEGLQIVWGKPSAEDADKIARGEVICGGCDIWSVVCGTLMNRECQACGHQWYVKD